MDKYTLEILSKNIKIAPMNIIRENFEILFLNTLSKSRLNKKLIFYGGTALRLAYGSPRFSEDIDFLMVRKIKVKELENILNNFVTENKNVFIKDIKDKRNTIFALINFSGLGMKHPINIKIEICKKRNNIKSEFLPLVSPCSHLKPIVLTATIESLKILKIETIKKRKDPKDWFDLWYICKYLKEPFLSPIEFPFDRKEFIRELKRFLPIDKWELINQIYV